MDNETKQIFEMLLKRLDSIEEGQKDLVESQNELMESQNELMESQKGMIESQRNMEMRQDEIFLVVKAIEHSNNTHKAEIDNLTYKVVHTEGTINKIGDVITERRAIK